MKKFKDVAPRTDAHIPKKGTKVEKKPEPAPQAVAVA